MRIILAAVAAIVALTMGVNAMASDPGPALHRVPAWMELDRATSADKAHFNVHGECVIALTMHGHGWVVCEDGQFKVIPF